MFAKRILRLIAAAVVFSAAGMGFAAELQIGDAAPDWSGIVGIDDQEHGLVDYKDAKLVVIVFTCNSCPVARAYEDRLVAVQKDYKKQGVQLVAVNVNNGAPDRLEPMKERAADKKFNFPYLYDSTQKIAVDYGATTTPHVFVADGKRKIAYVGAVDNSQAVDRVTEPYLRNALDALLAGKEPPKAVTRSFGCTVKYDKK